MNDSATSLDRLHDVVVPDPVPFWPPAPGWYVVMAAALACLSVLAYRLWKQWRANAYRREALHELATAQNAAEITALLRRVALVIAPRSDVAEQIGENWPEWLADRCPGPMPDVVRDQLAFGVYRQAPTDSDTEALRSYAQRWISHHEGEAPAAGQNSTLASG